MNIETFSLMRFEWALTALIFLMLVLKLADADQKGKGLIVWINIMLGINFIVGLLPMITGEAFSGFFQTNSLIVFEKNILNFGLLLISLMATRYTSGLKNLLEFYILLLTSMLGVFVMLSSGHILMLYLGLEMSTIPLAALANYNKNERRSSEAGMKLILSSAFSTGILLFGISLLYGAVGNLDFESIATLLQPGLLSYTAMAFILGGFAFKMSIVPFHLWTADVYEGSPVPVTNYLSVISKGSVIFIFVSVLYTVFGQLEQAWLLIISILAILSMTIGNLFALRQDNIKRLLAFSSISQVGFVLVGIAGASELATTSVVYFVLIYTLSNIAAFGVVGAIADATGSESLNGTYKGLYKSNPMLALALALTLFSLAGIPPTAGFFGKLFLLTSGMSNAMYVLLSVAAINLVISLYNYLRIVKIMFVDETESPIAAIESNKQFKLAMIISIAGIVLIGFIKPIYETINALVIANF